MESDEESRSSSQSNSSDSGNSRESSPAKDISDAEEDTGNASVNFMFGTFDQQTAGGGSRSQSSSSSSSKSSSGSSSTSSSSESDDEDANKPETGGNGAAPGSPDRDGAADVQDLPTQGNDNAKSPSSGSSSSGSGSTSSSSSDEGECDVPEDSRGHRSPRQTVMTHAPRTISPVANRQFSRRSNDDDAGDINISHEDLSDVSDNESEKRECSKQTPNSDDDDDDNEDDSDDDDNAENLDNSGSTNASKDDDDDGEISNDSIRASVSANATPAITANNGNNGDQGNDLRNKLDTKKQAQQKANKVAANGVRCNVGLEDLVKTHDDDALDFEAEEGECQEICKEEGETPDDEDDELKMGDKKAAQAGKKDRKPDGDSVVENKAADKDEELEEGEVSDEDEKRPEETEPKPVCRFYTRGQCTWGMSCRFLHPGVTDKGNYTMFESMVRSVPMPQSGASSRPPASSYANHNVDYHDFRNERPSLHHRPAAIHHPTSIYTNHHEGRNLLPETPVVIENAWERGLRTAKEMMRKANKRKEQDMDFEDKKMNLTLSPDELEKDPYFVKERASSPSSYAVYTPPERYDRARHPYMVPYEDVDAYGRMTRYRELPPHRMPQYEDDRRLRPAREVIVQRVENVGRGDEWSDPWMRAKSPGGRSGSYERDERHRRDRRSYSSNSSYSSSNSSQSDSSSDSSRSSSITDQKRRFNSHKVQAAPSSSRRHAGASGRTGRSTSPLPRRPRRSPSSVSLSYKRTANDKKTGYSPAGKRKKASTPPKKPEKTRRHRSSSSSDSDSSGSSYSDSDSSSSDSSSASKERTPQKSRLRVTDKALNERKQPAKKPTVEQPVKKRSPISIEIKKPATVGVSALVSPTHSANSDKDNKKSRREELLKQLRAVEDAIAKKRSKLA